MTTSRAWPRRSKTSTRNNFSALEEKGLAEMPGFFFEFGLRLHPAYLGAALGCVIREILMESLFWNQKTRT